MIAGDASLNGNLYVGGDISWNPNSLANDSIPSSAIIGGAVGATGPAGRNSTYEFMLLSSTGVNNGEVRLDSIEWDMHGTTDMLGNPQAIIAYGTSSLVYNGNHQVSALTLNFKPGVYKVSLSGRMGTGTTLAMGFDLDNNNRIGYSDLDTNEEDMNLASSSSSHHNKTFMSTFVVPHQCNFHLVNRNNGTWHDRKNQNLQLLFERVGIPDLSGTDDDVHSYGGIPIVHQRTIAGGLYWGSTVTKPTDQDEYLDLNESGTAWIYRIDPTSSVEVASFHSDADLSLNKRLFVGEFINTTNFYNVNSLLMPYYLVEWTNPSVGDLDTTYDDFRLLFKAGKLHTNIHSNQLSIEAGSGGLSNASPDPDNYVAFKVYPGVWELNFELNETGVGSNANANYVHFYLYHDNGSGTTRSTIHMELLSLIVILVI